MALTKHAICYNPTDNEIDTVGSYLLASDGTAITHTGSALDVNIKTSDIQLEVDLDHTEDSIRLGDGTSFFTSTSENGDIALDVHLSNSNIEVTQGTSPWVIGDGGGSITVDFTRLDDTTDKVAIGDGTNDLAINADGSVNTKSAALDSCAYSNVTAGDTATDLVSTELSGRKLMSIQNRGDKSVFIGCDSSVTTSNGTEIPKGATAEFPFGPGINVHGITTSGNSADIRIIELA